MEEKSPRSDIVVSAPRNEAAIPTTRKEVWAWWLYMAAIEPISVAVLQLFMLLLLGDAGGEAQGGGAEGTHVVFTIGSFEVTTILFTYTTLALSVALQAVFFICFGALADYGSNRRYFLMISTVFGSLCCISALLVRGGRAAIIAGSLDVLITISFGASLMLYNSYLPLLAENHPETTEFRSDDPLEIIKRREVVANGLSTRSFMIGYASAVVFLMACAAYLTWIHSSLEVILWMIAISGVLWLLGSIYPLFTLQNRSGRDLPTDANVWTFSIKKTFSTLCRCKRLPNAFRYLLAYFLFADGCNTMGQVAVFFARNVLKMPYGDLIICTILAPLSGVAGNFFFFYLQRRLRLASKSVLVFILVDMILITVYGGMGIFTHTLGLHHGREMFGMAVYYGFHMGAMQSFSRVIFAELVPLGEESEFFSLYAITDKGSSWLGPAIQAITSQYLPDERYGLVFLGVMIALSIPILVWGFDPIQGKKEAGDFSEMTRMAEAPLPMSEK